MSVACDDAADGAAGMEEQKRKEIQQDVEEDLQMPLTEEKQLDSKQLDSKVWSALTNSYVELRIFSEFETMLSFHREVTWSTGADWI